MSDTNLVTIFVLFCACLALLAAIVTGNDSLVNSSIQSLQETFKLGAGVIVGPVAGRQR